MDILHIKQTTNAMTSGRDVERPLLGDKGGRNEVKENLGIDKILLQKPGQSDRGKIQKKKPIRKKSQTKKKITTAWPNPFSKNT